MAGSTSNLTTEIFSEIRRLQDVLREATERLKQRREVVEKQCRRCRDLFRPWPQKVHQEPSSTKINEKETKEQQQEAVETPDPDEEKEKAELAMLDEILLKAQQARAVHTKLSKSSLKSGSSAKSVVVSGSKVSQKIPSAVVKEHRPKSKAKVNYPAVTKPATAKSTYAASYKKFPKSKQVQSGTRQGPLPGSATQPPASKIQRNEIRAAAQPQPERSNLSTQKPSSSLVFDRTSENKNDSLGTQISPTASYCEDSKTVSAEPLKKFLLSEKGSSLTMPPKYLRICKDHRKLILKAREVNSVSLDGAGENFCKQVEKMFCPTLSGASGQALDERFDSLVKEYEALLSVAKSTVYSLQLITESSESETVEREVTQWQFVTSRYQQLNDEAQRLTEAMKRLGNICPCSNEHESSSPPAIGNLGVQKHVRRNGLEFSLTSSPAVTWQLSEDDGFFTYYPKELKELQKLSHDYEMAKFHLELRKTVGGKILPLLRQLPTDHRLDTSHSRRRKKIN